MTMTTQIGRLSLAVPLVLAASVAAQAQGGPPGQGRGGQNAVKTTTEAFGLSEEQVEQIRDIRRERPERGMDREAAEAWREEQRSKIDAVLTDEQRAKVAEIGEARETLRAYPGALMLGLVEMPGRSQRGFGSFRNQGQRGPWAGRGRGSGQRPGFQSRGRRGFDRRGGAERRGSGRDRGRGRR